MSATPEPPKRKYTPTGKVCYECGGPTALSCGRHIHINDANEKVVKFDHVVERTKA